MSDRLRCNTCGWIGRAADVLRAPSPFDASDELRGCPICKSCNDFVTLCEIQGCTLEVSCGTPVPGGYMNTCSDHKPEAKR